MRSGATLPLRCIFSNVELTAKEQAKARLPWTGKAFQFQLRTTFCEITWAIARDQRPSTWSVGLILAVSVLVTAGIFFVHENLGSALGIGVAVGASAMAVVASCFPQKPSVKEYSDGYFVLEGFGDEFLNGLDR